MDTRTQTLISIGLLLLFAAGLALSAPETAFAGVADAIEGEWEGSVDFTSSQPVIQLSLNRNRQGEFEGRFTLPAQDTEFQVENLEINSHKVKFDISNERTDASFEGVFSPETRTIKGNFLQAGHSYPFTLESKWTESATK